MNQDLSNNLDKNLENNRKSIVERLKNSLDLTFRDFQVGQKEINGFLVYFENLVDHEWITVSILKPLMLDFPGIENMYEGKRDYGIDEIQKRVLPNSRVNTASGIDEVIQAILSGQTAMLMEGSDQALILKTQTGDYRAVSESETEAVVRGPREGFIESIGVNVSLLRRKIKNENLKLESLNLGQQSNTKVNIVYIEGIANPKIVEEVRKRLSSIDIDAILESGYIEEMIEDAPQSIYPTVGNTEKPDVLAAKLLEGRVGIMVNGTPFVLTVPYLLVEAFQNAEDYYARPFYASLIRFLRYISYIITTILPSFYVALQSYHQEMIPTPLLISMSEGREGVPFPAFVEAMMMGIIYEILREAGVRMPRPVGQAVSIVGALVIGEAAVQAGLVSQTMVIVVSLTAVSGFVVPALSDTVAVLRLYFLLPAAALGLFGWQMAFMALLIHLASLRSFGIPYTTPIMPMHIGELQDVFIRSPIWAMVARPALLSRGRRQGRNGWQLWKGGKKGK